MKVKHSDKICLQNLSLTLSNNTHCEKVVSHNSIYERFYNDDYLKSLFAEEVQPSEILRKQQVSEQLRAKMVNWMLEVYGNYDKTSTNFTFSRAVTLMD